MVKRGKHPLYDLVSPGGRHTRTETNVFRLCKYHLHPSYLMLLFVLPILELSMILLRQKTLHASLLFTSYPDLKLFVFNYHSMHFQDSSFLVFLLLLLYMILGHVELLFVRILSCALACLVTENTCDINTIDIYGVPYRALEGIPVHSEIATFAATNGGLIESLHGDHMINILPHSICTACNQDVHTISLSHYP